MDRTGSYELAAFGHKLKPAQDASMRRNPAKKRLSVVGVKRRSTVKLAAAMRIVWQVGDDQMRKQRSSALRADDSQSAGSERWATFLGLSRRNCMKRKSIHRVLV